MAGKDMFLASVKEAESYGANVLMLYTGAPQNTRRKEIKDLNIEKGWEYAAQAGINEIVVHAPVYYKSGKYCEAGDLHTCCRIPGKGNHKDCSYEK